jgi:PPOX class probable F420-dependent enzyme
MTTVFDEQNEAHQKAQRRLRDDAMGWLVSVRPDGRPHAAPIWFFWHDGQVLVFSEEKTQKIRNLRHAGKVVLHLDSDNHGEDIVIVEGTAEISGRSTQEWLPEVGEAYAAKYADGLKMLGLTVEQMAVKYTQVIVITPDKVISW